jgi:hypothetical protein
MHTYTQIFNFSRKTVFNQQVIHSYSHHLPYVMHKVIHNLFEL